jgi:hypothetical protein
MKIYNLFVSLVAVALWSCGGAKNPAPDEPGQSHSEGLTTEGTLDTATDGDAGVEAADEEPAPVTFVLKNTGEDSLFLNMDKGLSAVIYAYSGQPPNAKTVLPFPTHCTAACDSPAEDICPVCEEPQKVKEIQAAEKHDEIVPGAERRFPWDAMVFRYKKTKGIRDGKRTRCSCYSHDEPPAEEYTIKACGIRKTKTAKASSKYECVESSLTLPITEPTEVELVFGG